LNLKAVGDLMRTINPKKIISKFMVLKPYYIYEYFGYKTNTKMGVEGWKQMVENAEFHHSE